jgi:hypothetical protein
MNTIASISTGSFHIRKGAPKYHFIHRKKKYRSTATGEIGLGVLELKLQHVRGDFAQRLLDKMQHAFEPFECLREFRNQLTEFSKHAGSCSTRASRTRDGEPP